MIADARTEAADLVADDPELHAHPLLAERVAALIGDQQAEYLEKA
jgi:ATP-dependent DNA helicase RecG